MNQFIFIFICFYHNHLNFLSEAYAYICLTLISCRYGPIFRTSLAGRPVVVSTDPDFNNYIVLQEGNLVELYYMDTFSKIFRQTGESSRPNASGVVHKYVRAIFLNHFGAERLRESLLPQMQECVDKALFAWSSTRPSVEVKHAASVVVITFIYYTTYFFEPCN